VVKLEFHNLQFGSLLQLLRPTRALSSGRFLKVKGRDHGPRSPRFDTMCCKGLFLYPLRPKRG